MRTKYLLIILFLIPFVGISQNGQDSTANYGEESMPNFPGGMPGLGEYLRTSLRYPVKAKEKGIEGTVLVNFVISKEGDVTGVNVLKGVNKLLDAEAVRVVENMPKWSPGVQRGEKVSVSYNIPIKFKLKDNGIKCNQKVFTKVDKVPLFKGDVDKLNGRFSVGMHIAEGEFSITGVINVLVIIDCNGEPVKFKLTKGVNSSIDKRVIDVLENTSEFYNWTAGYHEEAPINYQMEILIDLKNGYFTFKMPN